MKNPKVGDRVAVYRSRTSQGTMLPTNERDVGFIKSIDTRGCVEVEFTSIPESPQWLHPMQCRRLVKAQRERIWVLASKDGEYPSGVTNMKPDESPRVRNPEGVWREFVAVRAKK